MTDEEKREVYFAQSVLGSIDNVNMPMLVYDEEKQVVKKALRMYIDTIRNEQNIIRR